MGDNTSIHFETRGEASNPPLLLIMGLSATIAWWPESFLELLARDNHLILIDNRGVGKSKRGSEVYSMKTLASDVKAVLDHLKIEKTNILGISMGGMIAIEFSCLYPEKVNKLMLFSTTAGLNWSQTIKSRHFKVLWSHYILRKDVEKIYFLNS